MYGDNSFQTSAFLSGFFPKMVAPDTWSFRWENESSLTGVPREGSGRSLWMLLPQCLHPRLPNAHVNGDRHFLFCLPQSSSLLPCLESCPLPVCFLCCHQSYFCSWKSLYSVGVGYEPLRKSSCLLVQVMTSSALETDSFEHNFVISYLLLILNKPQGFSCFSLNIKKNL